MTVDITAKMNRHFKNIRGGLFTEAARADAGDGVANFMKAGGDVMCWADPFFPDPAIPDSVTKALHEAIDSGFPAHYSASIGDFELRETLAEDIRARTGLPINPSRNIIVTPGSDSGLLLSMLSFIEEGDEVMVPNPSYPNNFLTSRLLGAETVPVPLYEEDNYQIRIEEFEKRLTPKTKMVLISHPNNPTTTVFRREGIEALSSFIVAHNLVLIADQAFQDHIFDGIEYVHPAALPGMWERTLTVCSLSKGIGLSGFRIGYIYGDDHIMDVLYGAAGNVAGSASTLSTIGAIAAIKDKAHLKNNFERLERRRRIAYEILGSVPGVAMKMSESGILSWLTISKLGTAEQVAERIMTDARIMINRGTPYGSQGEGHIRIVSGCFNKDEDAEKRFQRIRTVLAAMAKR